MAQTGIPRGTVKPKTPVRPVAPRYSPGVVDPNDPAVQKKLADSRDPNASMAYGVDASGHKIPGIGPMAQYQPPDPYDTSGDPILAKIHAITATARANAQGNAIMQRNQLAVALGDATGITDDPNYADAAAHNPNSILAQLLKGYGDTVHSHDEALNKDNLFYSGTRAKTLTDDANDYQGQQYTARSGALASLSGIGSDLATALSGADSQDEQGLEAAYGRAQASALANGIDPGQITNNAVTNQHPLAPAAHSSGGINLTTPAGAAKAVALARPKVPAPMKNAYLYSANKRG